MADEQQTGGTTHPGEDRQFGYWAGHFAVVGSMIGAGQELSRSG